MKRTHSTISDAANSESTRDSKRIKITNNYGEEAQRQWYEFDELLGAFIQLSTNSSILNFAATSKTFWARFHSKNVWQAAGFSLYYASDIFDKEVLKALFYDQQFALDAPLILPDLMSNDRDKNIGAACHLNNIVAGSLDPSFAPTLLPRLLEFVELHEYPILQIASIDALSLERYKDCLAEKLVSVILATKSRDVKYTALWALGNCLDYSEELSAKLVQNKELTATMLSTLATDGVVSDVLAATLRLLNMMNLRSISNWSLIAPFVPPIVRLLKKTPAPSSDCSVFACNALRKMISDRQFQEIADVVSNWEKFAELAASAELPEIIRPSIEMLNEICWSADDGTLDYDMIRNPFLMAACQKLLESSDQERQQASVLLLSNLATTPSCIQVLLDSALMPVIQKLIANNNENLGIIIVNMIACGEPEQLRKLVCEWDALHGLSPVFGLANPDTIILDGIEALNQLCKVSKENEFWHIVLSKSQETILPALEKLQTHPTNAIYTRIWELLDTYFVDNA